MGIGHRPLNPHPPHPTSPHFQTNEGITPFSFPSSLLIRSLTSFSAHNSSKRRHKSFHTFQIGLFEMKVKQTSLIPSLKAPCDYSQKSTGLHGSCSTLDSSEQEQQPAAHVPQSRSFSVLTGKITNAIKTGSLEDTGEKFTKNKSKPVRIRLVLKKNGGERPSLAQPLTPSKSSRKVTVRRKSFFGMTGGVSSSTPLDEDTHTTSKRRAVTPTRSVRDQGNAPGKTAVTPVKKVASRTVSQSKTCDPMPARKISLLRNNCRSFDQEISLPAFESPRRVVSRVSPEFLQISRRDLSVQDIIDEYNKIAGEGLDIE